MVNLSAILFSVSLFPAALSYHLQGKAHPGVVWALVYATSVGVIVAVAALRSIGHRTTALLGKSAEGRVRPFSWILFSPYHIGLRVKLLVGSLISNEPLYNKVAAGWYLGGWPAHAKHLPPGRPSVIDVTCELPRTHNHKYAVFPVWDTAAPTLQQLDQAVEFCLAEAAAGRPVYIHCAHGHGRSATVMIACFLDNGMAKSIDHGIGLLKAARPKVNLSHEQRQVLEQWVEKKNVAKGDGAGQQVALKLDSSDAASNSLAIHRQAAKSEFTDL